MRNGNARALTKTALLWEIIATGGQSKDNQEQFQSDDVELVGK